MYYKVTLPKKHLGVLGRLGGIVMYCETRERARNYMKEQIPSELWHRVRITKHKHPKGVVKAT